MEARIMLAGVPAPLAAELRSRLPTRDRYLVVDAAGQSLEDAVVTHRPEVVVLGPRDSAVLAADLAVVRESHPSQSAVLVVLERNQAAGQALDAGADDWVREDASPDEVVVRVQGVMERARARMASARHERDGDALLELTQTLASSLEPQLVFHSACRLMARVMDVERCSIVMVDAARGEGVVVAVSEDRSVRDLRVPLARYPEIQKVIQTGAPLTIADAQNDPLLRDVQGHVPLAGSAILFPVIAEEKVHGVFFLRTSRVGRVPGPRESVFGQTVAYATGAAIKQVRARETRHASGERSNTEQRVRDLQKYEAFFEEAADGMVILDGDGVIVYANRECARQFGVNPSDLVGQYFHGLLSPDSQQGLRTVIQDVMRGRYRRGFDLYAPRSDGDEVCLSCSAGAVIPADGGERLCMMSFRDVTELREMQGELRATKEFLENLINSSVDAIIAADIRGNIILFNKGAESIYGYRAEDAVGRLHVSRLYPPGMAQEIMAQLRSDQHGGRGKLSATRKTIRTRTGEDVPVSLSASIIYENGEEVATVGIFTDLRELMKMERQLSAAQERLLDAEKATVAAQLAGAAAHELNQPLTSVLGYADMLKRRIPEGDPNRRHVDTIFREGERMADIVRKIGRITKLETKQYVGNTLIVDIDKSSKPGSQPPTAANPASDRVTAPPMPKADPPRRE